MGKKNIQLRNNMKIFQILQNNFARLGITSKRPRWNRQSTMVSLLYSATLLWCSGFLFFAASTLLDYTLNIFITTSIVGISMVLRRTFPKKRTWRFDCVFWGILHKKYTLRHRISGIFLFSAIFLYFIKHSESENSKIGDVLDKSNSLVEFWCQVGEFVMLLVTPVCLIFPRAIISYAIYYITNAGNEAFVLPVPHWYETVKTVRANSRKLWTLKCHFQAPISMAKSTGLFDRCPIWLYSDCVWHDNCLLLHFLWHWMLFVHVFDT